jgi:hypothetical protein
VRDSIITPFGGGVRYHFNEWRLGSRRPNTASELYNLRHSSLRVVVKKAFGVLKLTWKLIRITAPGYSLAVQRDIVYALTGLHNFTILNRQLDAVEGLQKHEALVERRKEAIARAKERAGSC